MEHINNLLHPSTAKSHSILDFSNQRNFPSFATFTQPNLNDRSCASGHYAISKRSGYVCDYPKYQRSSSTQPETSRGKSPMTAWLFADCVNGNLTRFRWPKWGNSSLLAPNGTHADARFAGYGNANVGRASFKDVIYFWNMLMCGWNIFRCGYNWWFS